MYDPPKSSDSSFVASSSTSPSPHLAYQQPRRAVSMPERSTTNAMSSRIPFPASTPEVSYGFPSPHSPSRIARRLQYKIKSRGGRHVVPLSLLGLILLCFLFFSGSSSGHASVLSSDTYGTRSQRIGRGLSSFLGSRSRAAPLKNARPGKDRSNGLSLLVQEEEELIAEDDLFWDKYEEELPRTDAQRAADADILAHKEDVAEQNKKGSLRALVWWLAEGGVIPSDWTAPSASYIRKIGARGMERLLEEIEPGYPDEPIFEDGWADYAKKRYRVVVFSKSYCPYSARAKSIINQHHLSPAPYIIELDYRCESPCPMTRSRMLTGPADTAAIQTILEHLTGRRTVPNILFDFVSIGGSDDLVLMQSEGSLKRQFQTMELLPGVRRRPFTTAQDMVFGGPAMADNRMNPVGGAAHLPGLLDPTADDLTRAAGRAKGLPVGAEVLASSDDEEKEEEEDDMYQPTQREAHHPVGQVAAIGDRSPTNQLDNTGAIEQREIARGDAIARHAGLADVKAAIKAAHEAGPAVLDDNEEMEYEDDEEIWEDDDEDFVDEEEEDEQEQEEDEDSIFAASNDGKIATPAQQPLVAPAAPVKPPVAPPAAPAPPRAAQPNIQRPAGHGAGIGPAAVPVAPVAPAALGNVAAAKAKIAAAKAAQHGAGPVEGGFELVPPAQNRLQKLRDRAKAAAAEKRRQQQLAQKAKDQQIPDPAPAAVAAAVEKLKQPVAPVPKQEKEQIAVKPQAKQPEVKAKAKADAQAQVKAKPKSKPKAKAKAKAAGQRKGAVVGAGAEVIHKGRAQKGRTPATPVEKKKARVLA